QGQGPWGSSRRTGRPWRTTAGAAIGCRSRSMSRTTRGRPNSGFRSPRPRPATRPPAAPATGPPAARRSPAMPVMAQPRAGREGVGARKVTVEQVIATRDRGVVPTRLTAGERRFWTAALPSMPTGGIVQETAQRIAGAQAAPRAKARAIYDWVVDNTFRDAA